MIRVDRIWLAAEPVDIRASGEDAPTLDACASFVVICFSSYNG